RLVLSDARLISKEHFLEWTRKTRPQSGDIVLSRRCNPGETAVVPKGLECALGQNLVLLRTDGNHVTPEYLRWVVRGPEWWEQIRTYLNVGAVFDSLRCRDILNFQLTFPPLKEQRAITQVLDTLDDKIELNRRMNETLEGMARALFKSWFVDFDPVRAKAAGRDPSLPKPLADLFPDSFEESDLGLIPEGWSVQAVYDCAEFINGLAFRTGNFSPEQLGLPVIKIGELKAGITSQTKFTIEEFESKYRVCSGDVLFSWSGSPDTSIDTFLWTNADGWLNQHIFKVQFHNREERLFVYYLLRFLKNVFIEIARNKQTTGLGHVTVADMRRLQICKPPKDLLHAFNRTVQPIFDRGYSNNKASRTLSQIRDILLPKLISGELRIPTMKGNQIAEAHV